MKSEAVEHGDFLACIQLGSHGILHELFLQMELFSLVDSGKGGATNAALSSDVSLPKQ